MNKKIILVIVALIIVLAGVYFFLVRRPANTSPSSGTSEQPSTSSNSLKDLISKGIAQSCTFSNDTSSGTVYVSSGKVRGDFDTTVDSKVAKSHMIVEGNTSYIWTDESKTGFKTTFDTSATSSAQASTSPNGGFDASANMNYRCGAWIVDSSLFTLPTGVQFMSFGSTVPTQASPSTSTGGSTSSQCSYCDNLTGDSKTQCLTALKCE